MNQAKEQLEGTTAIAAFRVKLGLEKLKFCKPQFKLQMQDLSSCSQLEFDIGALPLPVKKHIITAGIIQGDIFDFGDGIASIKDTPSVPTPGKVSGGKSIYLHIQDISSKNYGMAVELLETLLNEIVDPRKKSVRKPLASRSWSQMLKNKFEIQNLPRPVISHLITRGIIEGEIYQFSGAVVNTRGNHYISDEAISRVSNVNPLYLLIRGPNEKTLYWAVERIRKIIKEAKESLHCDETEPITVDNSETNKELQCSKGESSSEPKSVPLTVEAVSNQNKLPGSIPHSGNIFGGNAFRVKQDSRKSEDSAGPSPMKVPPLLGGDNNNDDDAGLQTSTNIFGSKGAQSSSQLQKAGNFVQHSTQPLPVGTQLNSSNQFDLRNVSEKNEVRTLQSPFGSSQSNSGTASTIFSDALHSFQRPTNSQSLGGSLTEPPTKVQRLDNVSESFQVMQQPRENTQRPFGGKIKEKTDPLTRRMRWKASRQGSVPFRKAEQIHKVEEVLGSLNLEHNSTPPDSPNFVAQHFKSLEASLNMQQAELTFQHSVPSNQLAMLNRHQPTLGSPQFQPSHFQNLPNSSHQGKVNPNRKKRKMMRNLLNEMKKTQVGVFENVNFERSGLSLRPPQLLTGITQKSEVSEASLALQQTSTYPQNTLGSIQQQPSSSQQNPFSEVISKLQEYIHTTSEAAGTIKWESPGNDVVAVPTEAVGPTNLQQLPVSVPVRAQLGVPTTSKQQLDASQCTESPFSSIIQQLQQYIETNSTTASQESKKEF